MAPRKKRSFVNKYLIPRLREMFRWSPARRIARTRTYAGEDAADRELARCELCQKIRLRSETHVDHVDPVGSEPPTVTWDEYIERMCFREEQALNLMVLCKDTCHKTKTKRDMDRIRANRKI